MDKHIVIAIGREFCSGGQRIAKKISDDLGIKVYDSDMLGEAAKETGMSQELFETHDEKPTNSFLYSLVMDTYSFGYGSKAYNDMPLNHKVFLAQFETIKKLAAKESCILLGRCADYALDEMEECTSVFLHADFDIRVAFCEEHYGLSHAKAKERVKREDKSRSSYYNFYTDKKWGYAASYDLCLDSGVLGIDDTAEMIEEFVRRKMGRL